MSAIHYDMPACDDVDAFMDVMRSTPAYRKLLSSYVLASHISAACKQFAADQDFSLMDRRGAAATAENMDALREKISKQMAFILEGNTDV